MKTPLVILWFLVAITIHASGQTITMAFRIDGPLVVFKTPEEIKAGVKQSQTLLTKEDLRQAFEDSGIPTNNITQLEYSPDKRYLVVHGPKPILDFVEEFLRLTSANLALQMDHARAFLKATRDLDSLARAHAILDGYWYLWQPIHAAATALTNDSNISKDRLQKFDAAYTRWKTYLESELSAYEAENGK